MWWRTHLPGVTRNRCNTVFANVIETSKSNVPQKLSDGHNTKKKVLRCFSMSIATLPTMFSKPYLVYIFLRPSSQTLKEYLLP